MLGESTGAMTLVAGGIILGAVALIVSARSRETEEPAVTAGEPASAPPLDEGDLESGTATA
jgi:hypothetical protein